MKVGLSIEALAPDMGGVGRYTWELARNLPRLEQVEQLRFWRQGRWFEDPALHLHGRLPKRRRWMRHWSEYRGRRYLRDCVFHGTNHTLPERAERGVVTIHDLSVFLQPEHHPLERVRFFEANVLASVTRAAAVITPSWTIRNEVLACWGLPATKVHAVPLGVSDAFAVRSDEVLAPVLARMGLAPQSYALSVATLEPRKKFPELLRAWSRLPDSIRRRWPLAVAGGAGWLNEDIRHDLDRGVAGGWVLPLGYVREDLLPALYAGSRLFVYPSTYEGFGLPPIEAMASGTPVIVADASCLPEVTKGAAMLIDPDNVEGFTAAIVRALTDDGWREAARDLGRTVAAGYRWDVCAAQTAAVYATAVS